MDYKARVFVSVVVYLRDHAGFIREFIERSDGFLRPRFENVEYVFVDDVSKDGSVEAVMTACREFRMDAVIIQLAQRHDKERAIFAGTDRAIGDYIFEFDSPIIDYPIEMLLEMFDHSRTGEDVVVLAPRKRAGALLQRVYYQIFNSFSCIDGAIGEHRVILLTRRAVNAVLDIDEKKRYRKVLLWMTGFRTRVMEFAPLNRDYKDPRTLSEKIGIGIEYLVSYSSLGSILPLLVASGFFLFSLGIIGYVIVSFLIRSEIAAGWTSIMLFLSISFCGLFLVLGILCQYVTKILRESINLPMYNIKTVRRALDPVKTDE